MLLESLESSCVCVCFSSSANGRTEHQIRVQVKINKNACKYTAFKRWLGLLYQMEKDVKRDRGNKRNHYKYFLFSSAGTSNIGVQHKQLLKLF